MTILSSTSDVVRVVTGSAVSSIEVQASFTDLNGSTYTPGSQETEITTATTTTVVSAPGASTYRRLKQLTALNSSTSSCVVTVQKYDGTNSADLFGATLLGGESLVRETNGRWAHLDARGAPYQWGGTQPGHLSISGAKAETFDRMQCQGGNITTTSGQLVLTGIYLYAGTVINSISFFTDTTAAGTPTNQIFGLYSLNYALLATTNNDTTTAWAASTIKTLNLTSAYTVRYSGWYYVGIMVTATTMPGLQSTVGSTLFPTPFANSVYARGVGASGLTTALPGSVTITSGFSYILWACVS